MTPHIAAALSASALPAGHYILSFGPPEGLVGDLQAWEAAAHGGLVAVGMGRLADVVGDLVLTEPQPDPATGRRSCHAGEVTRPSDRLCYRRLQQEVIGLARGKGERTADPAGTIQGMLLVPGDPLNPRRVDPHFAAQAAAARERGIVVAKIDHDALGRPDEAVAGVPAGDDAVYRGWMMSADEYEGFAKALDARRVTLRTSADEYRTAHELPGWYEALKPLTPESVWTQGPDLAGLDAACERLGSGPAVLRDHVKSMKHYWAEAAYIPDVTDREAVQRVATRFLELRGDAFTGGFVLRRFEEFTGAEARTWWIGGSCALVTPHPDTPDELPDGLDLVEIEPLITDLALPFVTVDLVRRTDGTWRIVELGDGQVSDWPSTRDASELIDLLF